jgi:hypothetical protein
MNINYKEFVCENCNEKFLALGNAKYCYECKEVVTQRKMRERRYKIMEMKNERRQISEGN